MTALADQSTPGSGAIRSGASRPTTERRTQARFRVRIPLTVTPRARPEPIRATSRDLSWGGVLLTLDAPLPASVRLIRVALPWRDDQTITADAHVQRATPLSDGRCLVAARFVNLSPRSNARLERLLKLLKKKSAPTESSGPPQLVRELEISVGDALELTQMLEQIESGHYTTTVFEAYQPDQSLCLAVTGTGTMEPVRLRARVERVRQSNPSGFDWAHLHDLTLKFEHPLASLSAVGEYIRERMQQSVEAADSSVFAEPSTWVPWSGPRGASASNQASGRAQGTSRSAADDRRPLVSAARSRIETDYPDALTLLTAVWGDVEGFGQIFQDLLLGERSAPGGWPPDAWDELTMLQDIHDRAYGLSAQQRTFFR